MKLRLLAFAMLLVLLHSISCKPRKYSHLPDKDIWAVDTMGSSGNDSEEEDGMGSVGGSDNGEIVNDKTGNNSNEEIEVGSPGEKIIETPPPGNTNAPQKNTTTVVPFHHVDITFFCPRKLREGQPDLVSVSIGTSNFSKDMRKAIVDKVNSLRQDQHLSSITEKDLTNGAIRVSDYIKVVLEDPSHNKIDIKATTGKDTLFRKFDPQQTQNWEWIVTPKKGTGNKGKGMLAITVYGKNSDQSEEIIKTQYYAVTIALEQSITQAALQQSLDIKWLFALIGSIVTFFVGLWQGQKKKEAAA